MSLAGKVYAVTGGASGIGLATAKQISARGGTVCIADVDANALAHAEAFFAAQTPAASFAITKVDVSKRDQVEAWIGGVVARFGRLDGAANIAGVIGKDHGVKPVAELDDDDGRGSIVNMASIHSTTGMANHGAYAASKHGVLGLTRAAAKENGAREVRVNAVAPGSIYTPMMQQYWDETARPADAPFSEPSAIQRLGTADEVANVVLFLLGPESTFVSGAMYSVDGAWL
ncbi:Short-chain dehydrogenase/reductase ABA4 like protein [Verticillium longisporum]|nr:Short-chain dehydrogenase/reductase ABA4 like protein [Verticillium longisporum]